ncbi:hypothetical protein [Thauera humireducens]|uniref:hypothetical protein n=1 Tax=Thauera humireducens TaxID=1134435 RepID=UPI00311EC3C0
MPGAYIDIITAAQRALLGRLFLASLLRRRLATARRCSPSRSGWRWGWRCS